MSFKVTINKKDIIEVDKGNTILETALENGLDLPHGCRSGNCGACKSKIISGEIEMLPYSEFALEDIEKDDGYILACRSVPWSDCEITVLNEEEIQKHKIIEFNTTVKKIEKTTNNIYIINLECTNIDQNFNFLSGQYAEVTFGKLPAKHYSMANSPNKKDLEFHIKVLSDGETSKYIKNSLKLNEKVKIKGPYGDAYLRTSHKGPIIAIAGGTGLAPILSIVESCIENNMKQSIKIFYGAQNEKELYSNETLYNIAKNHKNIEYIPVLNTPSESIESKIGNVTDAVLEDIEDFDGYKAYLAGPPKMVESAEKLLIDLGIRKIDMHSDAFYTTYEQTKEN